ncbi:MAG: D-TA family PLP-dependent enzyme [Clostridia bacterium]|nr:D-TA family PLP-dependent enzyme [Clostridia bacterium]
MKSSPYRVRDAESLPSPSLLFFEPLLRQNIAAAIGLAGGPERLWPHVKTHKCPQAVRMMMDMGIRRFKCATLAEAKMLGHCAAPHILLAYPLVGPNIAGFVALEAAFPQSAFYAVGDDYGQLALLSEASLAAGRPAAALLDLDIGMRRTGASLEDGGALYRRCAKLSGLRMAGLHCYDGHIHQGDPQARAKAALPAADAAWGLRDALRAGGLSCDLLVLGGSPTFPVHASREDAFLSPGTIFLMDAGYAEAYPDLPFTPAACLFTRVISRPAPNRFTLDLGVKGIASEMPGARGAIVGMPEARPVLHSEEHWVFELPPDCPSPAVGQPLLVIPAHICPTCALYDAAHVVREGGRVAGRWDILRGR